LEKYVCPKILQIKLHLASGQQSGELPPGPDMILLLKEIENWAFGALFQMLVFIQVPRYNLDSISINNLCRHSVSLRGGDVWGKCLFQDFADLLKGR